VGFYPDIYGRDGALGDMKDRRKFCPA